MLPHYKTSLMFGANTIGNNTTDNAALLQRVGRTCISAAACSIRNSGPDRRYRFEAPDRLARGLSTTFSDSRISISTAISRLSQAFRCSSVERAFSTQRAATPTASSTRSRSPRGGEAIEDRHHRRGCDGHALRLSPGPSVRRDRARRQQRDRRVDRRGRAANK